MLKTQIHTLLIIFLSTNSLAQFKPTQCGNPYAVTGDTCSYQATIDAYSEASNAPYFSTPTAACVAAGAGRKCSFTVLPNINQCTCYGDAYNPDRVFPIEPNRVYGFKLAPGHVTNGYGDCRDDVFAEGFKWCVPVGVAHPGCPEPALTVLADPVAISFEAGNKIRPDLLTQSYQVALNCVQNGISSGGGSYQLTSAYRPTEYQRHIYEIVTKDKKLNAAFLELFPQCVPVKDQVKKEMSIHSLKPGQQVARPGLSQHEQGKAFDLTPSGLTNVQRNRIFSQCGVSNGAVSGEPWHIQ